MSGKKSLLIYFLLVLLGWGCSNPDLPRETVLENGVRVITKQNHDTPIVTVLFMVNAGSLHERDENHGISRLVEHALFQSSDHYKDIQQTIDSYGGQFRSETLPDFVSYAVTVDRQYMDHILAIFNDVFQSSTFSDSILQEAKDILRIKMKSEDSNLRHQLLKAFLKHSFDVHPYRLYHRGDSEKIEKLQVSDVQEYYSNLYIPENITISIAGEFNYSRTIRFLNNSLGSLTRNPGKTVPWEAETDQTHPEEVIQSHSLDEQIALVSLGWRAPSIRDPETFTMDVLVTAMGIGESSRLNKHIRNQMGSVYSVWGEYRTPREPGYCIFVAVCDPLSVEDVKKQILHEVDILRTDSITPKELDRALMHVKTQEAYSHQGTMGTAYYQGYWSTVKDFDFSQTYIQNIEQVSIQDRQVVAKKYLTQHNYTSLILLPAKVKKGEVRR